MSSRAEIVDAALALADERGLEEVSMRALAQRLGVGTMSIYHYVRNKEELLAAMADAVAEEIVVPGTLPAAWRDALLAISERTRDAFLRHEWLIDNLGNRPIATPNWLRHIEQSATAVSTFSDDRELAFRLISAADDYTIGFAVREISRKRWEATTTAPFRLTPQLQELVDGGDFPFVQRFFADGASIERPGDAFEVGLQCLFDGFDALSRRR